MKYYVGLDLSMDSMRVCIVDENGGKVASMKVESAPDQIAGALDRVGDIEGAVIESGRMPAAICHGLRASGVPVVCIGARQAHQNVKALKVNKTDPHDAAGLPQFARTGFYKEVHVKSTAAHGARCVIAMCSHLVEAPLRLKNTIRGICATFRFKPGPGQDMSLIDRVMTAADIPGTRQRITALVATRAGVVEQIRQRDRALLEFAHQSSACRQLMSIPGVGVQTSAASAAMDQADRFRQSRTVDAHIGLVPGRHQSGEIDWTGRITRQDDSMVCKLLYEAANSILTRNRDNFALATRAQKVAKRRDLRKARVAPAVIKHAMLRDGAVFEA